METIAALELVVGFPVLATVSAAARGTLRIETRGTAYGLNLETGERIPAEPAVTNEPLLVQPRMPFGSRTAIELGHEDGGTHRVTTWSERIVHLEFGAILMGDDDRVVECTASTIQLLDRVANQRRSIAVPPPLELGDRVTGGSQGDMDRKPVFVDPGFVVFVRSPALLVVSRDDLERALVFDRVRWAIETRLAIREPALVIGATRGRWNPRTVVTDVGTLDVDVPNFPVQARDRLWPPNGWAFVDLMDGTAIEAFTPPPPHRGHEDDVAATDLFFVIPPRTTWPAMVAPEPPAPPDGFADLAAPPPRPTFASAIEYAKRVRLVERRGRTGPDRSALEQLANLLSPHHFMRGAVIAEWVLDDHEDLYEATAYAVPALVAIAADPNTPQRRELAEALLAIGRNAYDATDHAVLYAFRRSLPLLLDLRNATRKHVAAWAGLVRILSYLEAQPAWWREASRMCPDLEYVAPDEAEYD